jgi:hypothetical protein
MGFIKTDNDTHINEKNIRWFKKLENKIYFCTKSTGCNLYNLSDCHILTKQDSAYFNKIYDSLINNS